MKFYERDINDYLELIPQINNEIEEFFIRCRKLRGWGKFVSNQKGNRRIEKLLSNLLPFKSTNTAELDKILKYLSMEFVPVEQQESKSIIELKFDILTDCIDLNKYDSSKGELELMQDTIDSIANIKGLFSTKKTSCLIVVAVPVEFRAIYRKLNIVTLSENDFLFDVLDSSKDELKDEREDLWVEGVLKRNNKYVKVAIQFLREYGSLNSLNATKDYLNENKHVKEVISVGIAGQMDKTNGTLIGDLVVSTGFYNAYTQKLEDKINYGNKQPILHINDYANVMGIQPEDWSPNHLFEERPIVKNPFLQRGSLKITKGLFVSGPPVVKNAVYKNNILDSFVDCKAVEMEASGCHFAIAKINKQLRVIKAICDWSDESKSKEWQPFCADLAAEFTVDYLIAKYGKEIK